MIVNPAADATRRADDTAVQHLGDVWMVHQRQRLPFLFEALEHCLGIYAGFDELERDLAFDGLCAASSPLFATKKWLTRRQ